MKKEKSSTTALNHEAAMQFDREISEGCEPAIRGAVEKIHSLSTPKHTLTGKPSLQKLVREHIDMPVKDWLQRLGEEPLDFSKVLLEKDFHAESYFTALFETRERLSDWITVQETWPDLAHTCDTLIAFTDFCRRHRGAHEIIVQVKSEQNPSVTHIELVPAKKSKGVISKIPLDIDFARQLCDSRFCELCADLNEQASELLRILRMGDDGSAKLFHYIRSGEKRISTQGFSPRFCSAHSPDEDPVNYKRGLAKRKLYGSMRRLIIRARVARKLSGSPIDIIRTASFALADQCPDIQLIEVVPDLVASRHDQVGDRGLKEHLETIVAVYERANHPLTKFASSVCYDDGDKVYDEALNCGLHSDERELLIQAGFISNPILSLLKSAGTRIFFEK